MSFAQPLIITKEQWLTCKWVIGHKYLVSQIFEILFYFFGNPSYYWACNRWGQPTYKCYWQFGTLRCAVNKSNSRGSWVRSANATSVLCYPQSLKYPVAATISFNVVRHLNLFLSMDFDKLRPNLFVQVRMILGRSNKNFFSHNTLSFTHEH